MSWFYYIRFVVTFSTLSHIIMLPLIFTAQLPEVTMNTETCLPVVNLEKKHKLQIHRHPIGVSFGVFDK